MELSEKDLENVRAGNFSSEVGEEMLKKIEHSQEYTDDRFKKIERSQEYIDDRFKEKSSSDELTLDMLEKVVTGVPRDEARKNLESLRDTLVNGKQNDSGIRRH